MFNDTKNKVTADHCQPSTLGRYFFGEHHGTVWWTVIFESVAAVGNALSIPELLFFAHFCVREKSSSLGSCADIREL